MAVKSVLTGILSLLLLAIALSAWWFYAQIWALSTHNPGSSAFIKQFERQHKQTAHWQPVDYDQIATAVKQAVITSEDARFMQHHGVDWIETRHAMQANWQAKRIVRGGSTISQQLVKNLFFSETRSVMRKLLEYPLSYMLESRLSKQRILELYLNLAEWGEGIYGIEAAAWHYYQRPAAVLTSEQAAHLAAMLPNPRYYQHHPSNPRLQARIQRIKQNMQQARIP